MPFSVKIRRKPSTKREFQRSASIASIRSDAEQQPVRKGNMFQRRRSLEEVLPRKILTHSKSRDSLRSISSEKPLTDHFRRKLTRTGSEALLRMAAHELARGQPSVTYDMMLSAFSTDPIFKAQTDAGQRIGFYHIREQIGRGNFSRVFLSEHSLTKDQVALKTVNRGLLDIKASKLLQQEIYNLSILFHPNIVLIYEAIETPHTYYIALELCGDGTLHSYVKNQKYLEEEESRRLFVQLMDGIEHMHSLHIVHRDIKAENVYLSNGNSRLKIGDFGFSIRVGMLHQRLMTFCGSAPYAAPELFQRDYYLGPQVDIWALGVLLFFMVQGVTPFRGKNVTELKKNVMNVTIKYKRVLSGTLKQLIGEILKLDSAKRMTIPLMRRHEWVTRRSRSMVTGLSPSSSDSSRTLLTVNPLGGKLSISPAFHLAVPMLQTAALLIESMSCNSSRAPTPEGSVTFLQRNPLDYRLNVIDIMVSKYRIDRDDIDKQVLEGWPRGVYHPLAGIFRLTLDGVLHGRFQKLMRKHVRIRNPSSTVIGRSDGPPDMFKKRDRHVITSTMCTVL